MAPFAALPTRTNSRPPTIGVTMTNPVFEPGRESAPRVPWTRQLVGEGSLEYRAVAHR